MNSPYAQRDRSDTATEAEVRRLRTALAEAREGVIRHATVTPGQRAILAAVFDAAIADRSGDN
jgi:hypothetical protein